MKNSNELNFRLLKERVHAALGAFKNLNVFLWPGPEQADLIERTLDEIANGYESSGRTELRFTETMPGGRKEERTASFADVERLQKGLDALKFGERALEFVRPTAEQIESGAEDWGIAQAAKGYALFEEQDPKGAMAVQGLDDVGCFESDRDAARQWEIDTGKRVLQPGVDFWFGDESDFIPYIDTPENRKAMKDWLLEKPLEFHWPDFSEKKFKEIVKELHSGNAKEGAKARACLGSSWFDLVYDGENKIYRLECRCKDTAAADYISTTYRPITLDDTKGPAEFRASLERDIIGFIASIGSEALRSECKKDPSAAFEGCEVREVHDKTGKGFFEIITKNGGVVDFEHPKDFPYANDFDYWMGFEWKGRQWDLNFFGGEEFAKRKGKTVRGASASVYAVGEDGQIDMNSRMDAKSAALALDPKIARAWKKGNGLVHPSGAEWDALCDLAAAAKMDWFFEEASPSTLSNAMISDVETAWLSPNLETLTGERFFAVRGLFQRAGEEVSEEEVPERFKIMDEIIQWMSDESKLSDWTDAEREVARQAMKDWESVSRDPDPADEEKEDERYDHETLGMLEVHAARIEAMRKWRRLEERFNERPDIQAYRGGFAEIKDEVFENDEIKAKLPWKDEPGFLSRESLENLKMDFSEAIQAIERPQREAMEETVYRLLEEWVDFGPLEEFNAEIGDIFDEKFVKKGWDDSLAGKNCFYADSVGALREIVDNGSFMPSYVTVSPDGRSVATDEGATYDFAYYDPDYARKAALMKSHSDRMEKRSSILESLAEEVVSGGLELSGVQEKANELADRKVALRNDEDLSADFNKMGKETFLSAHPDVLPEVYDASVRDAERLLKDNFETAVIRNLNVDWTKDEKEPEIEGVKILDLSPESAEGRKAALVAFKNQGKNFTEKQVLKALEDEKQYRWVKFENLQVFPYDAAKETLEEAQKRLLDSVKAKDVSAEKIFAGMQADGPDNTSKTFQEMKEWVETEGLHDRGVLFETVSRMVDGLAYFGELSPEIYDEENEYENGAEERMDLSDAAATLVLEGKLNSWKEIQEWVNEKAKARWSEIAGEEVGLDVTRDFESPDGTVHDWYGRYVNFRGDERLIMEDGYGEVLDKYLNEGSDPDATSKDMERFAALERAARERDEEVYTYLPASVLRMSDDRVIDWMLRNDIDLPATVDLPKVQGQKKGRWKFSEADFYKLKESFADGKPKSGFLGSVYFGFACAEFVLEEPETGFVDINYYVLGKEGEGEKFGVPYSYESGERIPVSMITESSYEIFKRLAEKEVLEGARTRPDVEKAVSGRSVDWSDESDVNEFFESRYGFTDDEEKMRDFREISKEEFLSSYGYLSESEYEATERAVEREWKKEVQEFLEKEWSKPEYKGERVPEVEAVMVWHPQEYGMLGNECLNLLVQLKPGLGENYSEEDIRQIIAGSALGWAGAVQETTFQPVLPEESGTFDKYLEGLKEAERENKRELAEGYANEVVEEAAKKAAEKFPFGSQSSEFIAWPRFEAYLNTAKIVEKNIESDNGEVRSILEVSVNVEKGSWFAKALEIHGHECEKLNKSEIGRLQIEFDPEGEVHSVYLTKSNKEAELYATEKISKVEREMVAYAAKKFIGEYLAREVENGKCEMSVKEAFFAYPAPGKVYRESVFEDDLTLASALNLRYGNPGGEKVAREEAKAMLHYLNAHDYSLYATDGNGKAEFYVLDVSEDFTGKGSKVKSIQDLLKSCHDCLDACEEYDFGLDDRLTKVLLNAFVKFDVRDVMETRGLSKTGSSRPTDIAAAIAEETQKATLKESVSEEYKAEWLKKRKAAEAAGRKFDPFQATKEIVELWNSSFRNESLDALNDWLREKDCVSKEGFERLFKEIEAGERKVVKKPRKKTKGELERGV